MFCQKLNDLTFSAGSKIDTELLSLKSAEFCRNNHGAGVGNLQLFGNLEIYFLVLKLQPSSLYYFGTPSDFGT